MHRMVLRFVLPALLLLAFGGPASTRALVASSETVRAASPAGFTAATVAAASGSSSAVALDFGRYGALRLALKDSGVVTKDTVFTRTTAAGVERIEGAPPRTLAGTVAGDPASNVRLTVARGWVAGFVFAYGRLLAVAPDDWEHPTTILVSEAQPARLDLRAVGDEVTPIPSGSRSATADPTPTPTLSPLPTPSPTLPPTPTPSPVTIATSVPVPTLPTLPSPFPATVWPTPSPPPSPVPGLGAPEVSTGVYNCRVIRCNVVTTKIILDADAAYTATYGSACADRQASILNIVDGIFMRPETRVHYVAMQVNCRTVQAPLGGPGTSTAAQLDKLRSAWDGEGPNRSIVHLAVGYDFGAADGIGRAYLGGVCGRLSPDDVAGADVPEALADRIGVEATPAVGPIKASISAGPVDVPDVRCAYGFSLYQGVKRPNTNYIGDQGTFLLLSAKISAHELGHNFNADHEPGSACPPARTGTLLCEELQDAGPNVFSSAAAKRIRDWAESKDGSIIGS